jgi:hypothetical protein
MDEESPSEYHNDTLAVKYEPAASPTPAFLCHCGVKCGPHKTTIEPDVPMSGCLNASPLIPPVCPIWCMQLLFGNTWLPGGAT